MQDPRKVSKAKTRINDSVQLIKEKLVIELEYTEKADSNGISNAINCSTSKAGRCRLAVAAAAAVAATTITAAAITTTTTAAATAAVKMKPLLQLSIWKLLRMSHQKQRDHSILILI